MANLAQSLLQDLAVCQYVDSVPTDVFTGTQVNQEKFMFILASSRMRFPSAFSEIRTSVSEPEDYNLGAN